MVSSAFLIAFTNIVLGFMGVAVAPFVMVITYRILSYVTDFSIDITSSKEEKPRLVRTKWVAPRVQMILNALEDDPSLTTEERLFIFQASHPQEIELAVNIHKSRG